ncbi:hypothetical protein IWX92DRAFT_359939 [Phyllosticta citricarpa]
MPPRSWLVLVFYSLLLLFVMAMSVMIGCKCRRDSKVRRLGIDHHSQDSRREVRHMSQVPSYHTAPQTASLALD